jgi:hypothetical protein
VLCIGLLFLRTRQWRLPLLPVYLALALLAPLIPLARHPGIGAGSERYFIALWAAVAVGVGLLAGLIATGRNLRYHMFSGMVMVLLIVSARQHADTVQAALLPQLQEQFAQGRALITAEAQDCILLTPHVAPWYIAGIVDLHREFGRKSPPPRPLPDEIELSGQPAGAGRLLRYDPSTRQMTDCTLQRAAILAAWQRRVRPDPLPVMMEFDPVRKTLHWRFGPPQGQHLLLSSTGSYPLPAQGSLRMDRLPQGHTFRVRHNAPDGWITYTPVLGFVPTPQGSYRLAPQGAVSLQK